MITLSGSAAILRAQAQFRALADGLPDVLDETAADYLTDLIARMRPLTPVVTGRMKAGYYIERYGPAHLELRDQMDYAPYPLRLPRHAALLALLQDADTELGALLNEAIARRVAETTG